MLLRGPSLKHQPSLYFLLFLLKGVSLKQKKFHCFRILYFNRSWTSFQVRDWIKAASSVPIVALMTDCFLR